MEILKNNIEKICSFYVSDWHLVTMLLPYINTQINEKANIITILENNIEENVKTLVSKLNLKNEKEILELNWKSKTVFKYSEIKNIIRNIKKNGTLNIIFVNGNKNYIDIIDKSLDKCIANYEKQFQKDGKKNLNIKIINCFEVSEFNYNIEKILNTHDKILNTSGERKIEEVFEGYA